MSIIVSIASVIATIAYFVLALGPAPAIRRIHQTHSVGVTPIVPLVSLFMSAWIWSLYGIQAKDYLPVLTCNLVGLFLAVVYTTVYYFYTDNRPYAHKVFACFGSVCIAIGIYAFLGGYGYTHQSRDSVKDVLGYLGNAANFIFFVAPFENIKQVFRHRSGVFIPIQVVATAAVNSVAWIVYSLLVSDWLLFAPNAGALAIGSTQIALYFYFYPSSTPTTYAAAVSPPGHDDSLTIAFDQIDTSSKLEVPRV